MPRPLAQRHLARLHELTHVSSVLRVMVERHLVTLPVVVAAAQDDAALDEEVTALARERGWTLPEPAPYTWSHVGTESDPLPRLARVLDRDAFELDGISRITDDEDVRSLALQAHAQRHALLEALEQLDPRCVLPGAK
jgi:hypothetical protein